MKFTQECALTFVFLMTVANLGFAQNKEAEAINFLLGVNKHEIRMANIAKRRGIKNAEVIKFADLMIAEHSANSNATKAVMKANRIYPGGAALKMLRTAKKEEFKLENLNNNEAEIAYISAMVKGHQNILNKIDEFLREITNEAVKKHLTDTRGAVDKHLQEAKNVQSKLTPQSTS